MSAATLEGRCRVCTLPGGLLQPFDEDFGVAAALVVFFAAGGGEVVGAAFGEAAFGLEISEGLSGKGKQFVEASFAGFVFHELNEFATYTLVFVGRFDV